jgi:hypothetical protein
MSMPSGYPHDLPNEEIERVMATYARGLSSNINDVIRCAPLVQIGQVELQVRATHSLTEAIEAFRVSQGQCQNPADSGYPRSPGLGRETTPP